jgi:hypothetical protein
MAACRWLGRIDVVMMTTGRSRVSGEVLRRATTSMPLIAEFWRNRAMTTRLAYIRGPEGIIIGLAEQLA